MTYRKSIQADAFAFGDVSTARKPGTENSTGAYGVRANQCRLVAVAEINGDGIRRRHVEARFGRGATGALRVSCAPNPERRGALGALRTGASRLDAKHPAFGLNQESRGLSGFGLAAWVFAASAFTRPASAATWGAAVIGPHTGNP
jgi:hypothetical protein